MKKGLLIIFTIFVISVVMFFSIKKIIKNKILDNSVIDFNYETIFDETKKNNNKYFLFSDYENIYYLNGLNPKDVTIITSSINEINKDIYEKAREEFKEGKKTFLYGGNNIISFNNVVYAAYDYSPDISILSSKLDIIKNEKEPKDFELVDIVFNKKLENTLYYTDRFGIKIYTDGIEKIYVSFLGKTCELREVLNKDVDLSDDVYYSLKKAKNSVITSYLDEKNVIEGVNLNDIRITQNYVNGELYYNITKVKK